MCCYRGMIARVLSFPRRRPRLLAGLVGAAAMAVVALLFFNLTPDERELKAHVPHQVAADDPRFVALMNGLVGSNVLPGNHIQSLSNGDEIFPAMLEAIRSAQHTVNFETFIYWSGRIAKEFAEALAERARAGVEVRVLLDWAGSLPFDEDLERLMTDAGAQVVRFRPLHWYSLDRLNNRTHHKLLIVDGRIGFTGGVGIGDEWLGDARGPHEWRDMHYRLVGPAVAKMQSAFVHNWLEAADHLLQGEHVFPVAAMDARVGDMLVQFVNSGAGKPNATHIMILTAMASATRSIQIGTPYFVPDDVAIAQLLDARRRGVEVDVIVPGVSADKEVVRAASRHFWGDLLEAGVRIHEYQNTMFHTKIMTVDGAWATVGSTNFDERSFRLNDEANLSVFDAGFVDQQRRIFAADLESTREVTLEEWRSRPRWQKLKDWVASHFRVQM
jgi:cardiolipin synthase A/B